MPRKELSLLVLSAAIIFFLATAQSTSVKGLNQEDLDLMSAVQDPEVGLSVLFFYFVDNLSHGLCH